MSKATQAKNPYVLNVEEPSWKVKLIRNILYGSWIAIQGVTLAAATVALLFSMYLFLGIFAGYAP